MKYFPLIGMEHSIRSCQPLELPADCKFSGILFL